MIADGGDDGCNIVRIGPHVIQQAESHDSSALGMIHTVNYVSDVVKISGDAGQFRIPLRMSQLQQDFAGGVSHLQHMRIAVLGVSQGDEGLIGLFDIGIDCPVVFYVF